MRFWFFILSFATLFAGTGMLVSATRAQTATPPAEAAVAVPAVASAYDFNLTAIDGKPLPFSQFRGQVLLVVNTASRCGFTKQYEGLQKLQDRYSPKGFTVIGIPSGDFGGQELEDNAAIRNFCETKFGITFPMAEKSVVKGPGAIPFYRWAKAGLTHENTPKWNFHKFLIGRDGQLIAGYASKITPESPELTTAIEKALRG